MNYELRQIAYDSTEYQLTLELRNEVMRKPIGLNIYDQDFSWEKDCVIVGAFDESSLCGVGVLSSKNNLFKVEYLCVDTRLQKSGLGGILLKKLEEIARKNKAAKISMDARVSAEKFYEKHGYHSVGEVFLMDVAPVDHIVMEKEM